MAKECWRPIPNSAYEVSNLGRVRSHRTVLKPRLAGLGYHQVRLRINGTSHECYIHALVLNAFAGPRPRGMECRHLNGNKIDNRLYNLTWGTPKQNGQDRIKHGTAWRSDNCNLTKLSWRQVNTIRRAKGPLGLGDKLARRYGVSPGTISMIRSGKTWRVSWL